MHTALMISPLNDSDLAYSQYLPFRVSAYDAVYTGNINPVQDGFAYCMSSQCGTVGQVEAGLIICWWSQSPGGLRTGAPFVESHQVVGIDILRETKQL